MSDKTIHEAFIEAYTEMPDPVKNADNPAFKRDGKPMRYADLEAFLDVAKPILVAAGFALVQEPVSDGDRIGVHTYLVYKTGEIMDFGSFTVALSKPDPQGAGAAITYCRRYSVAAIFGLAQEDDDANRASNHESVGVKPENADKLASEAQIKAVWASSKAAGFSQEQLLDMLKKRFGERHAHPDYLTRLQASAVIDGMKKVSKPEPEPAPLILADSDEDIPF